MKSMIHPDSPHYFGTYPHPLGATVEGRRGELRVTFSDVREAKIHCANLNKAFELGQELSGADPNIGEVVANVRVGK